MHLELCQTCLLLRKLRILLRIFSETTELRKKLVDYGFSKLKTTENRFYGRIKNLKYSCPKLLSANPCRASLKGLSREDVHLTPRNGRSQRLRGACGHLPHERTHKGQSRPGGSRGTKGVPASDRDLFIIYSVR